MKRLIVVACAIILILMLLYLTEGMLEKQDRKNPDFQQGLIGCNPKNYNPLGGILESYITIKPGETKETSYVFYAGKGEGQVKLSIYRVKEVFKTEKVKMLEGVKVNIEPSEFYAKPNNKYKAKITVSVSPDVSGVMYSSHSIKILELVFLIRAEFKNETIDDWFRVDVLPTGLQAIPGRSLMQMSSSHIKYNESITVKRGEVTEEPFILYTGAGGPGRVNITVYRVADVYKTNKISSKDIDVVVKPSCFMAKPHAYYNSSIVITTGPELSIGRYVFCIHVYYENGVTADSWLVVDVI